MRENSKYLNILITSLICLIVILCFAFLRIDTSKDREDLSEAENRSVEIYRPQPTEQEEAPPVTTPVNYTLKLENGVLNFYLNSEKETVLLESLSINASLFPKDDISALSESITVNTLEEGISIIEDFTS